MRKWIYIIVQFAVGMEASTKNVLWKCFENGGGKKLLFENELPDGFDYQVNRFKLLKESVIPHENKFEAAFLGRSSKKKRSFYGQVDRKGLPPPYGQGVVIFSK